MLTGLVFLVPVAVKLVLSAPYATSGSRLPPALRDPWATASSRSSRSSRSARGAHRVGPAAGRQKLFFLPEPHTDFIYAVIGEEFGFIGCVLVLVPSSCSSSGVRRSRSAPASPSASSSPVA